MSCVSPINHHRAKSDEARYAPCAAAAVAIVIVTTSSPAATGIASIGTGGAAGAGVAGSINAALEGDVGVADCAAAMELSCSELYGRQR